MDVVFVVLGCATDVGRALAQTVADATRGPRRSRHSGGGPPEDPARERNYNWVMVRALIVPPTRVACLAALFATAAGAGARAETAAPAAMALREQVRALAKPLCGKCHQGSLATAKPRALAVFDLDQPAWPARMRVDQFDAFLGRMAGKLDPAQRRAVEAFIAAERADRRSDRPR